MQDLGYELPRIPIPRTPVNKGCTSYGGSVYDGLSGRPSRSEV
jgi:hypothetical protein